MKKVVSLLLSLIILIAVCPAIKPQVSATSKTANEAISWCQSQVGKSLDYDGNGYWCVDLIAKYYQYLGVSTPGGNACDYATNALPSGWKRTKGGTPQKGDILVWAGGSGAGHVAIYESDNVTYHQRYSGQYVEKVTKYYKNIKASDGAGYWGCIHPNFNGTTSIKYVTGLAGTYYLQSKSTGYHLAVSESKDASLQPINTWGTWWSNFKVKLTAQGNAYKIKFSDVSSLLVNPYSDNPTNGTKINLYKDVNDSSQWWGFEKVGDAYVIRCMYNPSLVLTENGTNQATLTTYNGSAKQLWYLRSHVSGTVSYNANGGSGAPAAQSKYYNVNLSLSTTKPTRSGYTFLGWSTSPTATSATYSAGGSYTANSGVTLYAVWKANTYTVSYNANGGSGAPSSQTKYHNTNLTLSSTKPTRSGYTFLGWATNSSATSATYSAGGTYSSNSSVTLYAVWSKTSYIVYYNANGGYCSVASEPITYNSTYGNLPSATRSGYTFDGWYTRRDGGTKVTASTIHTTKGNITLYAHWTEILPQVPTTPKLSAVSNTASGVKITWGASTNADNYIVYRRTYNAKTKAWSGWSRIASGVTGTSYVDKTAKSGTYYRYTIKAINKAGNSGYNTSGLKTYFLSLPKVSSTANANSGVTVKWGKITGANGYVVYRKTTAGWTKIATVKGNSSVSYTDKTAKSGVTYKYTVRAYYSSYLSAYKESSAVRRLTTPTLKSVTSAQRGITLKWNKVTGATGYIIYRKTGNGSWQNMGKITGTTVVDTSAKKGVTYTYTVKAYYGTSTSYYNTKGLTIKDKY